MPTITKFEDLEIWKLARSQTLDFMNIETGSLLKDFSLRNQMNRSCGSVVDCIAEGFERSGNSELKHFLTIAKGSNGEYRSQLYRCLDRKHISSDRFNELQTKNIHIGNKLMGFINYLNNSNLRGHRFKSKGS